jgi:RimJ/RimL family protein N-acetyltransferase
MSLSGSVAMETPRLILRDFRPDDLPAYAALCFNHQVTRYLGGPKSAEEARVEMLGISQFFAESGFGMLAVERKGDAAFLGICGLSVETWYSDDLQIGWRLFPEHWGQGYATEAALAWRDLAFATAVPRLVSISDAPNTQSHRVMQRIGMRFDHAAALSIGDDRFDAHIYVLTLEDWASLAKL